jgi:hypothetical protein
VGGATKRQGAADERDASGKSQHNDENEKRGFGRNAEYFVAYEARKNETEGVPDAAANYCEEELLGNENKADGGRTSAEGLHQADFGAAFDDAGCRRGSNGECGREKRRESDKNEQGLNVAKDFSFAIGYAA